MSDWMSCPGCGGPIDCDAVYTCPTASGAAGPPSDEACNWCGHRIGTGVGCERCTEHEMDRLRAALASAEQRARTQDSERERMFARISAELDRAYAKHGRDPWGRHEFYAILLEEVDELWDAVKRDLPQEEVVKELTQVAAMCFRYIETGDRYRALGASPEGRGSATDG
jgi:NTP pyrophosphatase (non-canonical NTP hydrolase)